MSFKFNSDKEQIRAGAPSIVGDNEVSIRSGAGSDEKEVMRALLEPVTKTPRVGINRTGDKIDRITVLAEGSGYITQPEVLITAPDIAGGVQARGNATVSPEGRIVGVLIDEPGSGYTSAPSVSISGGGGVGAQIQAFLDTVDYELDINGAIRTSTSIISDTARILNLDIDNLVTPDAAYRAPNLKTFVNNTGTPWTPDRLLQKDSFIFRGANVYQALNVGTTSLNPIDPPLHIDGVVLNGNPLDAAVKPGVLLKHIGFRVSDPNEVYYNETGEAGIYPRSITPLLGDKSDKIATTEYVLNLATNDVGGRIYVSQQIGNDDNDGRSPVSPVRTIKKACQLAWETPGVKESIIVAGGDYTEDNPISIPPDASVVGDNLRLVIIRPANARKHIFKFGDKNYVIGVTYRDQEGADTFTWDFAMVFDDKQRITYDYDVNGDFGTSWPVGTQVFGPDISRATFQSNGGLENLTAGIEMKGVNVGGVIRTQTVNFTTTTGASAYTTGTFDFTLTSGSINAGETLVYAGEGERFEPNTVYNTGDIIWTEDHVYNVSTGGTSGETQPTHDAGTDPNGPDTLEFTYLRDIYSLVTTDIKSVRAEGEVVFESQPTLLEAPLPIYRIDFSQQGQAAIATGGFGDPGSPEDLGGIIFYTNPLVESDNVHDFKEGEEIEISGLSTSSPDLSALNGKQRIYKVIEDADGRSRRFVIPKKFPTITDSNYDPGENAQVRSFAKSATFSLLNSPFKFNEATPVARRFQDACLQIRNNREFIADEVVGRINDEFKQEYFFPYDIGASGGQDFKVYLGTSRFVHTYVSGGTVTDVATGSVYNVTNFVYDNFITGAATITINSAPVFSEDDTILLAGLIVECDIDGVTTQKTYPSFNIPVSDDKCRRDIKHFLNALCQDLEFGSNNNIIEAGKKYIDGTNTEITLIDNEIIQTVRAMEYARELAIFAMRKWRTGTGLVSDPVYTPQYSTLPRYFDDTIIDDLNAGGACNNVKSAIDTLAYLFVDVIANDASGTYLDAAWLIARNRHHIADEAYESAVAQYPSLGLSNVDERKCRRDINFIISALLRDLILGGNVGTVIAAESYFTGTTLTGIPAGELAATRFAFTEVRDLTIAAMRNWVDASGNPSSAPTYTDIPRFTDATILADPAGNPLCANVESAITTLFGTLDDILSSTVAPGDTTRETGTLLDVAGLYTYADSYITDANGTAITVKATYDDYPIIEASPYTQNSSIISKLGGGGALVDGSKVKQPNCPFPGLNLDGTAKFPNQGKSMVASAFTIVSEGGTGYKVIEDGYTQLVSVFCIFCVDGILCETGGYASVTNSATNFGIFALRSTGFRRDPYEFDICTISNVSSTPTGRTILSVSGLGREPLEHYVGKITGFSNSNPDIEYFVDAVEGVTVGPPFSAQLTMESGSGGPMELIEDATGNPVSLASLVGETLNLHRPSICNSSSHTWEYAGSGTSYNALPENGGVKIEANEQVSEDYGRTYVSGTDELGDFKVGTFARIENRTGNITFTGTVTMSEVEFLKLKGGDVVVTGFDASNTLGGSSSSDSKLPTQKAVKDYITNNLGPYIGLQYSTFPVPGALVQLNDQGKINEDQIPPLRPFEIYTVDTEDERLALEGALAGDIAIQNNTDVIGGTPQTFILNNDNESLFASFAVDPTLQFTIGDVFTGNGTGGKIQATEYRQGVLYQVNITDGGSGYLTPPVVTVSGGNPQAGAVAANITTTIANGQVVIMTIELFNGYIGGKGYTTPPTITIAPPAGSGTQAFANALIESRLYGTIVNNIKIEDTDSIESSDLPAETINIVRVVNTSGQNDNNWVQLSSDNISAQQITSGTISPARLATNASGIESAANSFTFLRGDQSYAPAVQTIKGPETRYFAKLKTEAANGSSQLIFDSNSNFLKGHEVGQITGIQADTNVDGVLTEDGETTVTLSNFITDTLPAGTVLEFNRGKSPLTVESSQTQGGFVEEIVIQNGGSGFTDGTYFNVQLSGGAGTGLRANITVQNGAVVNVTIVNGGSDYGQNTSELNVDFVVSTSPTEIGPGTGLNLLAKVTTVLRQYANVTIDVDRVSDLTTSGDAYGTLGVARFLKQQFLIGEAGNGSVSINTGPDSGLDADTLDGAQGSFYLNSTNQNAGTLPVERLSGTYNISISNQSGSTLRLRSADAPLSNQPPDEFSAGITAETKNNSADGLSDGGSKHMVITLRNGGTEFDASFGGVRQLAFTDATQAVGAGMWLRGSYNSPANAFGNWYEVWHSGNHGEFSGLDADKMDGRQGTWYQTGENMNFGILSTNRIAPLQRPKDFLTQLRVVDWTGSVRVSVLVRDELLNAAPFQVGTPVNLYTSGGTARGTISLTKVDVRQDTNDAANNYTLLTGSLTSGDFDSFLDAEFVGTGGVGNSYPFQDWNVSQVNDVGSDDLIDGTYEVIVGESVSGNARLSLGRKDGIASSPSVYFNSSSLAATNYNVALIATGGDASDGSGTLEVKVGTNDSLTVNGNKVWNAGNVEFNSTNVVSTAVIRDASGNFAAGTITADLSGAASENVLKSGDTMTGSLTISNVVAANQALEVSGRADFLSNITVAADLAVDTKAFVVDSNSDYVGVGTATPGVVLDIFRFTNTTSNAGTTLLRLTNHVGADATQGDLDGINGQLVFIDLQLQDSNATFNPQVRLGAQVGKNPGATGDEGIDSEGRGSFVVFTGAGSGNAGAGTLSEKFRVDSDGNVGIATQNPTNKLHVEGDIYTSTTVTTLQGITLGTTANNDDAPIYFLGSTGALVSGGPDQLSNFRMGNGMIGGDIFEITANDGSQGPTTWKSTPAIAIQGSNNRVAINSTSFSGQDQTDPQNIIDRDYALNVEGDFNINNGNLFVDNAPFVTSRWTESTNDSGANIYRDSKVGIGNVPAPAYQLHVKGSLQIEGTSKTNGQVDAVLYANGQRQWVDSYGIIKVQRTTIDEDVTIPANVVSSSIGDIVIAAGRTVTISSGGEWYILD